MPNKCRNVERAVQSFKNEALVHYPAYNLKKLNWITRKYCTYYNNFRPHQGIGNVTIPEYKELLKGKKTLYPGTSIIREISTPDVI